MAPRVKKSSSKKPSKGKAKNPAISTKIAPKSLETKSSSTSDQIRSAEKKSLSTKTPKRTKNSSPATVAKIFKLSLEQEDWNFLDAFFRKKGLRTATGIKMILRDFIETSTSA